MLLLIEIMLTSRAWKNGWRGRALLPLGIGVPLMFLFGLNAGVSGVSEESLFAVGLVGDLIVIGILSVMSAVAPRSTGNPIQADSVPPATPGSHVAEVQS